MTKQIKRLGDTGLLFTNGKVYSTDSDGYIINDIGNRSKIMQSHIDSGLWQIVTPQTKTQEETKMTKVQAGSVVKVLENGWDITGGKHYRVESVTDDKPVVKDDKGSDNVLPEGSYEVVAARTEHRHAKTGEKVLVLIDKETREGGIRAGTIVTPRNVDRDGDFDRLIAGDNEHYVPNGYFKFNRGGTYDYLVLIDEPAVKVKYKVLKDRNNKVVNDGDTVRMGEDYSVSKKGDIVKVLNASSYHDKFDNWETADGRRIGTSGWIRAYTVLDEQEIDLTAEIDAALKLIDSYGGTTEFVISEADRTVTAKMHGSVQDTYTAPATQPFVPEIGKAIVLTMFRERLNLPDILKPFASESTEDLKVGDYVKLLSGGEGSCLMGFQDGKVYKVTGITHRANERDITIEYINGNGRGYAKREQIQKVDHLLTDGCYAKVLSTDGHQMNGFEVGDIVEVLDLNYPISSRGNMVRVKRVANGHVGYTIPARLELVEGHKRPTVGDYVKVKELPEGGGGYIVGNVYKIVRDDEDNTPYKLQGANGRTGGYIKAHRVESSTEEAFNAQKTTYRPTVGDIVKILDTNSASAFKVGEHVKITRDDQDQSPYEATNKLGVTDRWLKEDGVELVQKASGESVKAVKRRLTVGDYARMLENGEGVPVGTLVKIVKDDQDSQPYTIETVFGGRDDYFDESELEPATEAEFEAAKVARPVENDKVVLVNDKKGFKAGDICEIVRDDNDSSPYRLKRLSDGLTNEWFNEYDVRKATEEELIAATPLPEVDQVVTVQIKIVRHDSDETTRITVAGQEIWVRQAELRKAIKDAQQS